MDILDILLDEDNHDPVTLTCSDGRRVKFEQVAVIPLCGKIYCILKPADKLDGVADDEAMVFRIDEGEDGCHVLALEEDEKMLRAVGKSYYDLLEQHKEGEEDMKEAEENDKLRQMITEMLFDENSLSDIVMVNEKGQKLAFRQVYASIKNGVVYCILAPAEEVSAMSRNDALLFVLNADNTFTVVKNRAVTEQIFSEYYLATLKGGK